ncbi:penicillin-binding transpeptidase domain-containing protein [Clostridioides difficile]|uniref:penicillin-binding transpeptidase domain-containing protein n=1 Tax=Clostridioides difficile TaxID=1496 RepID=UPI00038C98AE|nr:penicillin-binding transpeptidase domain-containing protein [Clostridioides difficile]EGT3770655.1 penicillin-binding protein [Clostridioides difficile]EGT3804500.1 penicillin-binding protein [Clostridioides difficile]EGT3878869.1 penicillin-binding protein [Clostridioides difficile]EGT4073742.1 penicillin-binding protein [Clostridioides difficile]EJA6559103.1 penicillin-binding protein [Clostridioides difficile]
MEENKQVDRLKIIKIVMGVIFLAILVKIIYMTTFKYEYYNELAENKTYKKLAIEAPRGEIKDRYGRLLAGNKNLFTVQVSGNDINKKDANKHSRANEISLKLINLLERNGEEYVDEFPIYVENGKYYYTYDRDIREYKSENGIPNDYNAKESFYYLVDKLISAGILSQEDKRLDATRLQAKLNENGYYPPILVSKWMFTAERDKRDWLASYKIKETKLSAKEAFEKVRNSDALEIDKSLSDEDARKIMVVRDLIKSKGYSQYNPVTIAKDVGETTIAQIEESAMDLVGVSIAVEPVRYYPNGSLASHMLGYVGKMPSTQIESYLQKGYETGDMVGLAGVEKSNESRLRGTDGYKMVKVDALGRISKEIESKKPKSGDTVYLTLDKDLQEVSDNALKQIIEVASKGGTFKSKFGDKPISAYAGKAQSAALIAIDVKNGEVLASSSYPNYDPNKFAKGISTEDYKALQPKNPNDLLAGSPLLNLVTQGEFQPGSSFKMVTSMAALENGLDPNFTINDPGVIMLGKKSFGDYVWNHGRGNHGMTNLYKAIQESCNIYMATIGTGKTWPDGKSIGIDMNANKILEYAKLFGLDQNTGLQDEVEERAGKVPSTEDKLKSTQALLKSNLEREMANDFVDITREKNPKEYEKRINEIVSWAAEKKTPGRVETMNRLKKLDVKEDRIEEVADLAVFSYFNFAKWSTADTFNLAIGQGENAYTPAQISRYVAAIANGGNLVELSVVDRAVSSDYSSVKINDQKKVEKIPFKNPDNLKELTKGMKLVARQGTAKSAFADFPIDVAAKTGTAEKSGKIPTDNEYEYLKSHMLSYNVNLNDAIKLADKMKAEKEKELSLAKEKEIKKKLENKDLKDEERKKLEEELEDGVKVRLEDTDKVNSSYLRKAIKELNPKITDDQIDRFKQDYGSFTWTVAFAPADDPEIAVVCVIPQGDSSVFSLLPTREVIGTYMGLEPTNSKNDNKTNDVNNSSDENINFESQINR